MSRKLFRKGIFMVTYHLEDKVPKFIIQQRKLHWTGWEFPKGGVKMFERNKTAIRREIKEETGLLPLKIKNHHKKGKYFYAHEFSDRPEIIGQTYNLFSVEVPKGKIKIDKKEHYSSKWVTYSQAGKLLTYQNQKDCLKIVNKYLLEQINKAKT